jgi:hypothetical protein
MAERRIKTLETALAGMKKWGISLAVTLRCGSLSRLAGFGRKARKSRTAYLEALIRGTA